MAQLLLHGSLDVTIFEAKSFNSSVCTVEDEDVQEELEYTNQGTPLVYATRDLNRVCVARTRRVDHNQGNPRWNESFHIYCAHRSPNVVFSIMGAPKGSSLTGHAYLPVQELLGCQTVNRWHDIVRSEEKTKPLPNGPQIHVRGRFTSVTADSHGWGEGVGDSQYPGVPNTFFKQRSGCKVTLYQDAHALDTFKPKIPLAGGQFYNPGRCWEDISDAIANARHLVYITGWSVYTEITLVRDGSRSRPGAGITVGELLKRKAREGVRVLMLL